MNRWMSLMQREWMQHRFGWTVAALGPALVMVVLSVLGQIELSDADRADTANLPTALALGAFGASVALTLAAVWITSLVLVSGMARRDHADRSVEFWLSMPVGHTASLAVPLVVHLLMVPIVAVGVGLLAGVVVSLILLVRTVGIEPWFGLAWLQIIVGSLSVAARLALGIVLATVWLLPLILLVMLMTAWFKRWGLVILAAGLGLGSAFMDKFLSYPWLADAIAGLLNRAAQAIITTRGSSLEFEKIDSVTAALPLMPRWAAVDAGHALGQLASPWLIGALLCSALFFAGLLSWRRRGAAASS